ncbi:MAG: PAS domain S-box protein [Phycisphaerales bacterium]
MFLRQFLRFGLFVLSIATVVALAGFAFAPDDPDRAEGPAETTPQTLQPDPALRGGTIRVGLPGPLGARGMLRGTAADPQGFLRDVFVLIAESEGLQVKFVPLDAVGGLDHRKELLEGRIDVLAGATIGETNFRDFRLSAPVVVTPGIAVTRKGTHPPKTADDLRALRVVVPAGGAGRGFAAEQNINVVPKSLYVEGYEDVRQNKADAMLTTMLAANWEIDRSNFKDLQVSVLEPAGFRRAYSYAVREDDLALMTAIESALLALQHDGRFQQVYQREVSRFQPVGWPASVPVSSVLHAAATAAAILFCAGALWQWRTRKRLVAMGGVLAESEARYRGIFEQSHDAIAVIDADTHRVIKVNRAAEQLYGFAEGGMVGVHVDDVVTEPETARSRLEQTMREGTGQFRRVRHRHRAGGVVITDIHSTLGTIDGKQVILAFIRDVTATVSQEDLIRSVIESSPHVAIQAFDRTGRIHFWNVASEELYGWAAEEAIGKSFRDLIHDDEAQQGLVELLGVLERERRSSGLRQYQVRNRSGEPRWVLSEIVPTLDVRGEPSFVCVDIDITAMKLAERRLQDAQARLAAALDAAGMGTWAIDVLNELIIVDQSMAKLLELPIPPGVPVPTAQAGVNVDPQDRPALSAAYVAAIERGQEFRAEYRIILPDGSRRWIAARGKLIRDDEGAVVRIGGASVDITDAKLAAADAERLRDELERAKRLEGLGLLAGGLAHDFNNLLVGIRGNTELAMQSLGADDPGRRAMELVVQATDRTAELTAQLLAAAGRSRLRPEPLDLNAVASESVELLRPRLGSNVSVRFEFASPPPLTTADGAQTRQALSNLLTNAADALAGRTRPGVVTVRTGVVSLTAQQMESSSFKERAAPGDFVFVQVADDGCGMDERMLERIFDPFYTTKSTGRGLGLSLVMMTVRRHSGAISIESKVGEGTVCTLFLPLIEPAPAAVAAPCAVAPRRGTALIIDDEPLVRTVIASMLKANGWTVTERDSGETGEAALRSQEADIVFLDLTMPGRSGVETAAAIRTFRPAQPIVFVSGYNLEMADSSGALAGEVFVQKPFDSATLLSAAGEAMLRAASAGQRSL